MKMVLLITPEEARDAAAWLGRSTPKMPELITMLRFHLACAGELKQPDVNLHLVEVHLAGTEEKRS